MSYSVKAAARRGAAARAKARRPSEKEGASFGKTAKALAARKDSAAAHPTDSAAAPRKDSKAAARTDSAAAPWKDSRAAARTDARPFGGEAQAGNSGGRAAPLRPGRKKKPAGLAPLLSQSPGQPPGQTQKQAKKRPKGALSAFLNKVIVGDCVREMKALPAESVDLVFADPPYNLQLKKELFRPDETRVHGVDDRWDRFSGFSEYDKFTKAWLRGCRRALKPHGALWVIGSYHNIFRAGSILQNLGFWILNDVIWIKANPMPNFKGTRFNNAHETLIWAAKSEKARFTFNYKTMKAFNGDRQMRSDWRIPICSGGERLKGKKGKKAHSAQKPEALLKRVILSSSRPGDVVLDPFFGSGTTGAAARALNRNFIGFERERKYAALARKRIRAVRPCGGQLLFQEAPRPRIPFGALVENNYLKPGEELCSKGAKQRALVMADGTVKSGALSGSIHSVASRILERERCNGWDFWSVRRAGKLVSINDLRERYFKEKVDSARPSL